MLQYKKYYKPTSKEELFVLMEEKESSFEIISGGTDIFAEERNFHDETDTAIDISGIEEFSLIECENGMISIGVNTCIQQFLENPLLMDAVPALRHSAIYFADQQIREIATIGGNLANASPCGDMIPPLLAMGATVHTIMNGVNGIHKREISIVDFIKGVGKTALEKGEIIQSISCPLLEGYGCTSKKVGLRRSLCISAVNSSFLVKTDAADKCFADVRIAFGGIAPTPIRLKEIEENLKGQPVSKEVIHKMVEYIPEDIVQSRSRKDYRKTIVSNFLLAGLYESLAETNILLL